MEKSTETNTMPNTKKNIPRLAHELMNQATGKTFREWANIGDILPENIKTNHAGLSNVESCMTLAEFEDALSSYFSTDDKTQDPDKIFPRMCRIDLVRQELENPGSTNKPQGFDNQRLEDNTQWKHQIKTKFQIGGNHPILVNNPPLQQYPGEIYPILSEKEQNQVIHAYKTRTKVTACEALIQAPVAPVELAFNHFLLAHVELEVKPDSKPTLIHRSRDATYDFLRMGLSAGFKKAEVNSLISHCKTCTRRVQAARLAHQKRLEKPKAQDEEGNPATNNKHTKRKSPPQSIQAPDENEIPATKKRRTKSKNPTPPQPIQQNQPIQQDQPIQDYPEIDPLLFSIDPEQAIAEGILDFDVDLWNQEPAQPEDQVQSPNLVQSPDHAEDLKFDEFIWSNPEDFDFDAEFERFMWSEPQADQGPVQLPDPVQSLDLVQSL
jgi:hypothetical protein